MEIVFSIYCVRKYTKTHTFRSWSSVCVGTWKSNNRWNFGKTKISSLQDPAQICTHQFPWRERSKSSAQRDVRALAWQSKSTLRAQRGFQGTKTCHNNWIVDQIFIQIVHAAGAQTKWDRERSVRVAERENMQFFMFTFRRLREVVIRAMHTEIWEGRKMGLDVYR